MADSDTPYRRPVIDPSGLTPEEIAAVMNKDLVGLTWGEIAERYGEDVAIHAGILFDDDAFIPTDEEFAQMQPMKEVFPELFKERKPGQPSRAKVNVEVTLDHDLLSHFQKTGPDWKTALNDTLRRAVFDSEKTS